MDLTILANQIIAFKGNIDLLNSFIQRDIPNILEAMGDTELKVAKRHFEKANKSSNYERELTIAITLLDSAYQKFRDASQTDTIGESIKELGQNILAQFVPFKLATSERRYYKVMKKAMTCTILIMTSYFYLKDQHMLNEYAERLKTDFSYYGGLIDYLIWVKENIEMEKEAMSSLCKQLGSTVDWSSVQIIDLDPPRDFNWIP
jgi:hypothetical protein